MFVHVRLWCEGMRVHLQLEESHEPYTVLDIENPLDYWSYDQKQPLGQIMSQVIRRRERDVTPREKIHCTFLRVPVKDESLSIFDTPKKNLGVDESKNTIIWRRKGEQKLTLSKRTTGQSKHHHRDGRIPLKSKMRQHSHLLNRK